MFKSIGNLFQKRDLTQDDPKEKLPGAAGDVVYTPPINATALGAVEIGAGWVARALVAAVQSPRRISAANMEIIGRELVRRGELVLAIHEGHLLPAVTWNVEGDARPDSWRYRIDTFGPSETHSHQDLMPSQVLHFRINCDPTQPWRGRSAIEVADETRNLATRTERSLADEAGGAVGRFVNYIGSEKDSRIIAEQLNRTRGALRAVSHKPDVMRNLQPGMGTTIARFGPNPPSELVNLHRTTAEDVLRVCGIPPAMLGGGGAGQREGWRLFILGLRGIAAIISEEISAKLGPCEISFTTANPLDVRARAYASLVDAYSKAPLAEGIIHPAQAAAITGLDTMM